ncbi:MAG: lipopolysaccharide kinase InaA family protein [Pseudazoarcus pumilus]|nr:lipopolysaccharide kinase InaA family protein [Pseudazoarcus pumilus]
MSTPPLLDTTALRTAGREPQMPCRVALADGREVELLRCLRVLPGKRIAAEGRLDGAPVLAKLFIADGAERHLRREREGIDALIAAGIDTPGIVTEAPLQGGGQLLATHFLPQATSLAERWSATPRPPGDATAIALIRPALALLARMHTAGLAQSDLHLGNFLLDGERLLVIDGDAVERHDRPLTPQQATDNLAILLAQLPPAWDAQVAPLLDSYRNAGGGGVAPGLQAAIDKVRHWRLDDLLDKSLRDCSLFAVQRSVTRFESVVRDEAAALAPLLADLDGAMARGSLLKDGRTVTVVKLVCGEHTLVVKRYNIKGFGHGLSRLWRPSRAWQSWLAAHRLRFLGIDTPRPLAMVEERLGPLRRRAWLISEWCDGEALGRVLNTDHAPPPALATALRNTFNTLARERIHHGDLKASNLLWNAGRLWLIDLDGTTAHRSPTAFSRAWSRDRARLLRNWPPGSVLACWLDTQLPR